MKAFYSDQFVLPLPPEHSFPMAKYRLVRERLGDEAILHPADIVEAPAADWDTLRLVHTAAYADAVRTGTLSRDAQRRIGFPWSPEMVERSRRSVGATIAAARYALSHPSATAANLAGGPHHAFADRGEGFCVFNDSAIAARALLAEGLVEKVVVLDTDVHQGNGTAAIVRGDARVFTFSIHGAKNYPFHKEKSDLDAPLPDGASDDAFLLALGERLERVLDLEDWNLAIFLAGADPFEGDKLGRLRVTKSGLAERDRVVLEGCRERGIPVAVTMAGGYAREVEDTVDIHFQTVKRASDVLRAERDALRGR